MKKRWTLFLAAVLLSGCLAACGKGNAAPADDTPEGGMPAGGSTAGGDHTGDIPAKGEGSSGQAGEDGIYIFTDDLGRQVAVSSHERAAALLGSYADLWVLAGGQLVAAPADAFEDFGLTLSEDTVNLGGTKSLSLELLLAAAPDFVLASTNTTQHLEWRQALEGAGIAVAYFDVACFEDYLRVLKICTGITGREECCEQYGEALRKQIDEVLAQCAQKTAPRVLLMRASAASIRAKGNEGNVLGEMLAAFGCVNIADTDDSLLENLSIESIVLQNPDKILVLPVGDDLEAARQGIEEMFEENPIWKELDAVKNGEVYYLDKHLYNLKPNARWAEAYEKLAEILYEE